MSVIKNNLGLTTFSIIITVLFVVQRDWFFIILLVYIYFINLLLSKFVNGKPRKILKVAIWLLAVIVASLAFYVNNYLPHASMFDSDCISFSGDPRGDGGVNECVEDTRDLNIPDWAKFLRRHGGGLLGALFFAGIIANTDPNKE